MENSKRLSYENNVCIGIWLLWDLRLFQGASWEAMMETGLQVVFFYLIGAITYYNTTVLHDGRV